MKQHSSSDGAIERMFKPLIGQSWDAMDITPNSNVPQPPVPEVTMETCDNCGVDEDYPIDEGPDDDPHGVTAQNAWKDEEYGLDDGCG